MSLPTGASGATGYGVTPFGFNAKPLATVSLEVDADLKTILGSSAGSEPDGTIPPAGFAGQLKQLIVDVIAAQWDLQEAVYSNNDPNQATGQSLDAVAAITGSTRESAEQSSARVTCTGNPNTVIQTSSVLTVTGTGTRFDAQAALSASDPNYPNSTIATVPLWAGGTGYSGGARVTNGGSVYQCVSPGNSASGIGPSGPSPTQMDGTVEWFFVGAGSGCVDVLFFSEAFGPVGANAGQLVNIATPIQGWLAANNMTGAVVGQLQETDSAFRARRTAELASSGNTTVNNILAKVSAVNEGSTDPNHQPPTSVTVYHNDTDLGDANGLTPHSIEVVVVGGTDADIAQAIWNAVGAGTATRGNTSFVITDSAGNQQIVYYSRPTAVPIYVTATVYYDASQWPANTSSSVVANAALSALLTYGQAYIAARSVRTSALNAAILRGPAQTDANGNAVVPAAIGSAAVAGLLEANPLLIGISGASGTSTISIGTRQIASFSAANCNITATTETP